MPAEPAPVHPDQLRRSLLIDRRWLEWNPLQRDLQIRLTSGDLFIDVSRARDRHDEAALARRRALEVEGRNVWFVSAYDELAYVMRGGTVG